MWTPAYTPGDGQTSWVYSTNPVLHLYRSCYVTVNKPVLSYLLLCLLPQRCVFKLTFYICTWTTSVFSSPIKYVCPLRNSALFQLVLSGVPGLLLGEQTTRIVNLMICATSLLHSPLTSHFQPEQFWTGLLGKCYFYCIWTTHIADRDYSKRSHKGYLWVKNVVCELSPAMWMLSVSFHQPGECCLWVITSQVNVVCELSPATLLTTLDLYIPRNSLAPPRSQRLNMNFQNRLRLFYHHYMSLNPHFKNERK